MAKLSAMERCQSVPADALEARLQKTVDFLHRSLDQLQGQAVLATSLGVEDMVLTDLIAKHRWPVQLLTLDTGRLHEETLRVIGKVKDRYGLSIRVMFPDAEAVEALVLAQGINGFYDSMDARKACCRARKVLPLKRALVGYAAWMTGLRREQSSTRGDLSWMEDDLDHGLQKWNPLVEWTEAEVWSYVQQEKVPYNALHDQGYLSIGCAPCTRAVQVGEDARAGRWWWEHPDSKECGLHIAESP